jgi:hypothetical protein
VDDRDEHVGPDAMLSTLLGVLGRRGTSRSAGASHEALPMVPPSGASPSAAPVRP